MVEAEVQLGREAPEGTKTWMQWKTCHALLISPLCSNI